MTPLRTEVAVIGGGLAGASFATRLAEAGRDVLLIEREAGPHDKVCGEFLSREAVQYLTALGLDLPGARRGADRKLASRGTPRLRRDPPALRGDEPVPRVLDEALLARAASRARGLLRGRRVMTAERDGGRIGLRLDDGAAVEAPTAVVATGKHDLRGHARSAGQQKRPHRLQDDAPACAA